MADNGTRTVAQEKMFYQTWWFWVILAGTVLGIVAMLGPGKGAKKSENNTTMTTVSEVSMEKSTTSSKQDVVLLNSGYSMSEDNDYIYWVAEYKNPEENSTAYYLPKITVTAYDDSGAVLATEDQTMNRLQPGERQIFGSLMDSHGQKPAKVEFTIDSGSEVTPSDDAIKASDLQIDGVTERKGEYGQVTYTGTVKNNGKSDASELCLVVALKQDGKVVYASDTFIDNVSVGQQKPFEITTYGDKPAYNSYEIMAFDWSF